MLPQERAGHRLKACLGGVLWFARELPLSQSVMENALAAGEPIICSVGPGDFTTSGHFIVLAGLEDGKFQVRDPNRRSTSEKLWDYDTLAGQITNLWAFSLA